MSSRLPTFRRGDALRADDLNALAAEIRAMKLRLSRGTVGASTRASRMAVEPFDMSGSISAADDVFEGESGPWDANDAASGRERSDALDDRAASELPREYLVDMGLTVSEEAPQDFWRATLPVEWHAEPLDGSAGPELESEDETRRRGPLRGVWRMEADADGEPVMVSESMFDTMPAPMWFVRSGSGIQGEVTHPMQTIVWPGARPQSVLLRCVLWWTYSQHELNYRRKSWVWAVMAQMDAYGAVRFSSKCVEGLWQAGYA